MRSSVTEIERYAIVASMSPPEVTFLAALPPHAPLLIEMIAALRSEVETLRGKPP